MTSDRGRGGRGQLERVGAVVLVALLVAAPVFGVLAVEPARATPSGLVTVPDDQITTDMPENSNRFEALGITVEDLEGSVYAEPGKADTLEVVLTTPGRARGKMGVDNVLGSGPIAIVFRDDQDGSARTIAVDRSVLETALGYSPDLARGTHDSGETFRSSIEYEDDVGKFRIDHFSSNTITYSGEVSITSSGASDGSTVSYDLAEYDSATDPSISLTGVETSETDSTSGSVSGGSGSVGISVAGNQPPSDADVTIHGPAGETYNAIDNIGDGSQDNYYTGVGVDGDFNTYSTEIAVSPNRDGEITEIRLQNVDASDLNPGSSITFDVYAVTGEGVDGVYQEGTRVAQGEVIDSYDDGDDVTIFMNDVAVTGGEMVTFEFVTTDYDVESSSKGVNFGVDTSPSTAYYSIDGSTNNVVGDLSYDLTTEATSVSASGTSSTSFGSISTGQSTTKTVPIDGSTSSIDVSYSGTSKDLNVDVSYTEHTATVDPVVSVNGDQQASYSGELSPGSTANFTGDASALQEGTNYVNVTLGSVTSDAPAPQVDLDYSHDASDKQAVNYTATKWEESYNVSKTFASDRSSSTLEIPFEGTVVSIDSVEKRVNGGSWQKVSSDNYDLANTTLTVDLGSVAAEDTVEVRTTGRKIAVTGGSVTVTDPTVTGERLDSKIRLDSWSSDAHLGVGGTPDGRKIHYAYSEDYSTAEYALIKANGAQQVYLPSASTGDELRVSTIPVQAESEAGEVRLEVESPRTTEPQFTVREGSDAGDPVSYTYVDAQDGETYLLYSQTKELVRDSGEANSPITLEDDDSPETLEFRIENTSSGGGGGGGGGAGPIAVGGGSDSILGPLFLAGLGIGGIGLVMFLRSRFGGSSASGSSASGSRAAAGARRAVGGAGSRLRGLVARVPAIGGLLAGLVGVLVGVVSTVASPVAKAGASLLGRRDVLAVLGVVGIVALLRYNILFVPPELVTLGGLAVILVGVLVALRRLDAFSLRLYLAIVAVVALLGAELIRPGSILEPLGQGLGSYVPILGLGALYIAYRAIKARQGPEKVVNLTVGEEDS